MPVTTELSKQFYDKLGDEVANELVNWFNAVDTTYRTELREMNELNFARFDARVGERFAESEAKFERRLAEVETKFERRLMEFEAKLDRRITGLELRVEQRLGDLRAELIRWMFVFWAGSTVTTAGLVIAAAKLLR